MKLTERISLFIRGWRRRSGPMLDAAGCPLWLQKRRCPTLKGWGIILKMITFIQDGVQDGTIEPIVAKEMVSALEDIVSRAVVRQ